ncbi:MAG TPA: ribonuclease III domain-containing protein [Clostridia bacterium]|nr:ribonuclease III domain-containing protein [Clostridia bacterium]
MLNAEKTPDLKLINPLTLAFVGDGVYEMLVREEIVNRHISLSANKLHILAVEMVRATAQARGFAVIAPALTEAEMAVFKRGRNANGVTPPRHTSAGEYRTATGLEALFGWLYLGGNQQRIRMLFKIILDGDLHEAGQDPDSEGVALPQN